MPSIKNIRASDGTGPAARASVTNSRAINNPTILVDTLTNWPTNFIGVTGTPDLVTKTIVPATLQIFYGHESGGTVIIDSFADGYTDKGNAVGDIVILKPTTEWADEVADVLAASMEDNGALKTAAVKAALNIPDTAPADYTVLAQTATSVTYNGNRSYDLSFPAVNYTDRLMPGTRLRTTRNTAAPTQSTYLNGTNQHWTKTSPAGMTFVDDYAAGGWIKLDRYPTGTVTDAVIIGRYNGASGWLLTVQQNGQVKFYGLNGGTRCVQSYQSLPLNKWVHVGAQNDMSAYTLSPTNSYIMIDGVDVPSYLVQSGGNPTALIQAGDLAVGAMSGSASTSAFPGKIAQAFVSSTKITQANMRTLMSQGITSSLIATHSIVSAYSFNGVATDLNTTNANNLTAQSSAVATNADSPFGGQSGGSISSLYDYGIVQKVAFSTNTTVTVQVPEGCTIPTSGGIASVLYSSAKAPFGFPSQLDKWRIQATWRIFMGTSSLSALVWGSIPGFNTTVPAYPGKLGYEIPWQVNPSPNSGPDVRLTLSTSSTTETDRSLTSTITNGVSSPSLGATTSRSTNVNLSAPTTYYALFATSSPGIAYARGDYGDVLIYWDNAYT